VLLQVFIYASVDASQIEITAKEIHATETSVVAKNGVVVYYNNTIIKSESAVYNKIKKLLILDGKIEIIGYDGSKENVHHMEIYTQTQEVHFNELFLVSKNDIWFYSEDGEKKQGIYSLGESVLSSCEIENPLWKMMFSKSQFDSVNQYMKVYNAKVYLGDMPVFYFPYLAFSTNKQRTSGFLFPVLGYSSLEGILYEQPIFWALSKNMDIEFNPQIRTKRSVGIYSTFRFLDSPYSSGKLRLGYFKDKTSYVQNQNLKNNTHYGLEFNYQSSKIISDYLPQGFEDGIYINSTFLNDIDYLNLQKNHLSHFGLTPLQESRLNYFAQNNEYYGGVNVKYFIDTRQNVNQNKTLQILPSLEFHKYLDHFLVKNFTYSVDFKMNNFDRKQGTTMRQAEMQIPLELTASYFDNYLNISVGDTLYYSKFFFGNGLFTYDKFEYYSTIHQVKLFSDLEKQYNTFIHIIQPSVQYIKPGIESQKPTNFSSLDTTQKELFTVGLPEEKYIFRLSQYFYDKNIDLKFYQRMSQLYYPRRIHKLGDLSNEMQYNEKNWMIYSNIIYSYTYRKIKESSTRVDFYDDGYHVSLGHTYTAILPNNSLSIGSNDIDVGFTYQYSKHLSFQGDFAYGLNKSSGKQWRFGSMYHQDCWSISTSVRQDITPRPTGFTTDTTFYVQLNFIPFGGIGTQK
jgi:LPS-assembly protein